MSEQTAVYDGNTLAGPLSEVFGVELTTAAGRCRSCGTTSQVATEPCGATGSTPAGQDGED